MQTPQIRCKGTLNQHLDAIRRDLAEAGRFAVPKVRADRDLGGGTGSMVQADQINDRQPASFLNVLQGLSGERNRQLHRPSTGIVKFSDRLAEAEPLNVKPRRHDAPTPGRSPSPIPL